MVIAYLLGAVGSVAAVVASWATIATVAAPDNWSMLAVAFAYPTIAKRLDLLVGRDSLLGLIWIVWIDAWNVVDFLVAVVMVTLVVALRRAPLIAVFKVIKD